MSNIFTDAQVEILENDGYEIISNGTELAEIYVFNSDTVDVVRCARGFMTESGANGRDFYDTIEEIMAEFAFEE